MFFAMDLLLLAIFCNGSVVSIFALTITDVLKKSNQ